IGRQGEGAGDAAVEVTSQGEAADVLDFRIAEVEYAASSRAAAAAGNGLVDDDQHRGCADGNGGVALLGGAVELVSTAQSKVNNVEDGSSVADNRSADALAAATVTEAGAG